ncbi:cation-transporting ATPase [Aureococcus anophagefferens]|nr:cation-transporting ATPase [Aureococcus anophagefferens]
MPSSDDDAAHVLRIGGMTCGHCVGAVTSALEGVAGVARADVDLERGLATVAAAPGASLALADLVDAVEASGFDASDAAGGGGAATTQTLAVEGMSCGQCEAWVREARGRQRRRSRRRVGAGRHGGRRRRRGPGRARRGRPRGRLPFGGQRARRAPPPREAVAATPKDGDDATWSVVELRVEGMTCAACASRVAKALRSLGVDDISVNCVTDVAAFRALGASPALVTRAVAAVKQAGYASSPDTARVEAEGEKAASDDPHVAKAARDQGHDLPELPAAHPAGAEAARRRAGRHRVPRPRRRRGALTRASSGAALAHRLSQLGYDASVKPTTMVWTSPARRARKLARVAEVRAFRRRAAVAFALAAPVFVVMMLVIPYGARDAVLALQSNALAGRSRYLAVEALGSLLLATPVQFVLGFRFYVGAFNSLRYGTANMDVLVALGTSAAYFYSIYVLYEVSGNRPCCRKFRQCSDGGGGHGHHGSHADDADCVSGHHFFETSSVLIAFVLLGKFMEAKAKGRTSEALQALLSLQPKMATVSHTMDDGGDYEEVVDAGSLSRGDVVKIKPGEAVPADGAVVSGESNCDESMLTGESMPVEKRPADDDKEAAGKVYGGTINAGPGVLFARVTAVGTESLLASIVKLVEQAQGSKTQIEALADYVARNFVAGVVAVAVAAFALWFSLAATEAVPRDWYDDEGRFLFAFLFSIAVLVVACPCALGLATPTAVMSNLGIEVWMLTGDNERTAQAIARQCGISRVLAKVRPDDKARNVTSLMDQGHVVAMIAVETADVVLIRSVLDDVATAIEVSRATFGRIKANLFFAGLQRVGHPHRRGALYPFLEVRLPPEVAALAMVLSSVSVVASSLSLRSYKRRQRRRAPARRPAAPRRALLSALPLRRGPRREALADPRALARSLTAPGGGDDPRRPESALF